MLTMVTLNERMEGFAGGVSATRVKLTVALPPLPVPPVVGRWLQEEAKRAASKRTRRNERALLRFMRHPTTGSSALALPGKENARNPHCRM